MPRWLAVSLLLLASTAGAAGLEGRKAPALNLAGADGVKTTLQAVVGDRIAIVLFWASWCPYCKALMPALDRIAGDIGGEHVVVVAVNAWEDAGTDPAAVLREGGHDFVLLVKGGKAAKAWKVRGTPGLFVVDRKGVVIYDRNARPLRVDPVAAAAPTSGEAASEDVVSVRPSVQRSAEHWANELRRVLEAELAAAGPAPALVPEPTAADAASAPEPQAAD